MKPKTNLKYLITGKMLNGQRFRLNTRNRAQALGITLMRGSVYEIQPDGHRRLISRVAG